MDYQNSSLFKFPIVVPETISNDDFMITVHPQITAQVKNKFIQVVSDTYNNLFIITFVLYDDNCL